jgi:tRNA (guanine-N7-)-methyltransferase
MGHKKLIKFNAIKTFDNVLEYPEGMAGQWHSFFKNDNPIVLELACGRGEYTIGLAQQQPHKNYVGIDIKGNRIWKGAAFALENNLFNVAFLRTQIDKITNYFAANEVAEIWITFPDPQLRKSKLKKRLTHPKFLRLYQTFMQEKGLLHLKTDSPNLYYFTQWVLQLYNCPTLVDYDDVYAQTNLNKALQIKTYYETLDIAGKQKTHYLQFNLGEELKQTEKDEILKTKVFESDEYPT